MIAARDMTQIVDRVRSEFARSPAAWLTNQWQPYLGAGRADNGRVPYVRAVDAAGTTANTVTWTSLNFEILPKDTASFYDGAQPAQLYFRNPGRYLICHQAVVAANATGVRYNRTRLNGATVVSESIVSYMANTTADSTYLQSTFVLEVSSASSAHMGVGGYAEFQSFQSSVANLGLTGNVTATRIANV